MKLKLPHPHYGITVIALWSAVLGLQNAISLVYTWRLDNSADVSADIPLAQFYVYQWVSVIFGVGFFMAAVGLWRLKNWGRIFFLIVGVVFFTTSMVGLFIAPPTDATLQTKALLGGRYLLSVALPFAYLNLPFVKTAFEASSKEQEINDG